MKTSLPADPAGSWNRKPCRPAPPHSAATLSRHAAARDWSAVAVDSVAPAAPSAPPTEIWIGLDAPGKSGSHAQPSTKVPPDSVTIASNDPIAPRRKTDARCPAGGAAWPAGHTPAALVPGVLRQTSLRSATH